MRRLLLAVLLAMLVPAAARAATLAPVGTFNDPVYVISEPTDPDRLLVVEQAGTIELSDHGTVSPFLDLTAPDPDLLSSGGERGLLSVALPPDYVTTHRLYVDYTRPDGDLEVDEFTATGDVVPLSSRRPLLVIDHSTYPNHNGGQLQFGPDGYLYISTGDGGLAGDPFQSGQNTSALLGKILRIDPHAAGAAAYTIPPGNPFAGATGADEVWSYGLRNPWRFSFDRLTGALLIGDVGQGAREEVDYSPAPVAGRGLNFGWNCREGLIAYTSPGTSCAGVSGFTDPIFDYGHSGGRCAITGGYVVRDASLGDLYGRYLFADECAGEIRSLVPGFPATGERSEGIDVGGPSSFGEDSCGRVYVASLGSGEVSRFVGATPADCASSPPAGPPPRCGGQAATRVAGGAGAAVTGSPGDDVIVADGRDNRIKAGAGDDLVCGLGGDDVLKGGPGKDTLRGGRGDDRCPAAKHDRTHSC
jgi:glucose/arabinose dehydrogenase